MKGYIAITTVIILSLLMLVLAVTFGTTSLLTRFGTADHYNKRISAFLARSCLEYAKLKLSENSNYSGSSIVNISSHQCTILPIEVAGQNKILKAKSQIQGATTNLRLTINASTLSTVSLEEVSQF